MNDYSIEHYKELLETNPKWLGEQARNILRHYIALEDTMGAVERYIAEVVRATRSGDVLAFVHGMPNDYEKAQELWQALPDDVRGRITAAKDENPDQQDLLDDMAHGISGG